MKLELGFGRKRMLYSEDAHHARFADIFALSHVCNSVAVAP